MAMGPVWCNSFALYTLVGLAMLDTIVDVHVYYMYVYYIYICTLTPVKAITSLMISLKPMKFHHDTAYYYMYVF